MKKFVLGAALALLCAAPAVAGASTYEATFTVNLFSPYNHTYNVTVDCATGHFAGTGNSQAGDTGPTGETVTGTFNAITGYSGTSQYSRGDGYSFSFSLAPTGDGSYAGTASDGNQYTVTGNWASSGSCRTFPEVTSKDECKKSGWKAVSRADDSPFKNQGDCVSYVQNGK